MKLHLTELHLSENESLLNAWLTELTAELLLSELVRRARHFGYTNGWKARIQIIDQGGYCVTIR